MSRKEDDMNKCDNSNMPIKLQTCYNNCFASSCLQLQLLFGVFRDGEYNLNVSMKIIKVFCLLLTKYMEKLNFLNF